MSFRMYDYVCTECSLRIAELFHRGEQPDALDCEGCGHEGTMVETIGAPTVLRASYHDGYKRGGDYQLLKEASKLKVKAASLPDKEKAELKKEASKLTQAANKERSKTP